MGIFKKFLQVLLNSLKRCQQSIQLSVVKALDHGAVDRAEQRAGFCNDAVPLFGQGNAVASAVVKIGILGDIAVRLQLFERDRNGCGRCP